MTEAKKKPAKKKAPAPRKPKVIKIYDTDLEPLKEADEILKKIELQQVKVKDARFEWEDAKEETKLLKGTYEAAQLTLEGLCRMRKETHPLFDKPPENPADGKTADKSGPAKKDAWQALPLSEAGITGNVAQLLADAQIDTLGALSDRMNVKGQFWAEGIVGLGEATAAKVSDCFVKFWAEHPEYCGE